MRPGLSNHLITEHDDNDADQVLLLDTRLLLHDAVGLNKSVLWLDELAAWYSRLPVIQEDDACERWP